MYCNVHLNFVAGVGPYTPTYPLPIPYPIPVFYHLKFPFYIHLFWGQTILIFDGLNNIWANFLANVLQCPSKFVEGVYPYTPTYPLGYSRFLSLKIPIFYTFISRADYLNFWRVIYYLS